VPHGAVHVIKQLGLVGLYKVSEDDQLDLGATRLDRKTWVRGRVATRLGVRDKADACRARPLACVETSRSP
jgi:hypothetical protein